MGARKACIGTIRPIISHLWRNLRLETFLCCALVLLHFGRDSMRECFRQMSRKKITLQDVARAAKVSTATVSRVANGNSTVEPEIQKRVLVAARRLGLDLTSARKNRSIAFVLGNRDTLNEFQSQVLMGAEGHCAQSGWDLQFISFMSDLGIPAGRLQLP